MMLMVGIKNETCGQELAIAVRSGVLITASVELSMSSREIFLMEILTIRQQLKRRYLTKTKIMMMVEVKMLTMYLPQATRNSVNPMREVC